MALAWAVIEELVAHPRTLSLFVTHYTELQPLAELSSAVKALHFAVNVNVDEQRLSMVHRVKEGALTFAEASISLYALP